VDGVRALLGEARALRAAGDVKGAAATLVRAAREHPGATDA
jgi:hypothetical protein